MSWGLEGNDFIFLSSSPISTIEVSFQEVQKKQCFAVLIYYRLEIKMGKQRIINEGRYL